MNNNESNISSFKRNIEIENANFQAMLSDFHKKIQLEKGKLYSVLLKGNNKFSGYYKGISVVFTTFLDVKLSFYNLNKDGSCGKMSKTFSLSDIKSIDLPILLNNSLTKEEYDAIDYSIYKLGYLLDSVSVPDNQLKLALDNLKSLKTKCEINK